MGLPAIAFAAACALSLAALADVPPPSGAHPLGSPALEDGVRGIPVLLFG